MEIIINKYVLEPEDGRFNFTLYKKVKIQDKDSKNYGKERRVVLGYSLSITNVIKTMIADDVHTKDEVINAKEYFQKINKSFDKIIKMINESDDEIKAPKSISKEGLF